MAKFSQSDCSMYLLHESKQHISADSPLMGLVQHDDCILLELWVNETLPHLAFVYANQSAHLYRRECY